MRQFCFLIFKQTVEEMYDNDSQKIQMLIKKLFDTKKASMSQIDNLNYWLELSNLIKKFDYLIDLLNKMDKTYSIIIEHEEYFFAEFNDFYFRVINALHDLEPLDGNILKDVKLLLKNLQLHVEYKRRQSVRQESVV